MIALLLAYVAAVVTVVAVLGWRTGRHLAHAVDHLARAVEHLAGLRRTTGSMKDSIAEIEGAAAIATVSKPGGADASQQIRALRASQIDPDEM